MSKGTMVGMLLGVRACATWSHSITTRSRQVAREVAVLPYHVRLSSTDAAAYGKPGKGEFVRAERWVKLAEEFKVYQESRKREGSPGRRDHRKGSARGRTREPESRNVSRRHGSANKANIDQFSNHHRGDLYGRGAMSFYEDDGSSNKTRLAPNGRFEYDVEMHDELHSVKSSLQGMTLYGLHSVFLALTEGKRDLYRLIVQARGTSNEEDSKDAERQKIIEIAEERNLPIDCCSKWTMNIIAENRPHQGVILDASPIELNPAWTSRALHEKLRGNAPRMSKLYGHDEKTPPIVVVLDEIQDPQNLGSILRSVYYLGISGVLYCAKNSAPLSGVVSKSSAGAVEILSSQDRIWICRSTAKTVSDCAENGWDVVGTGFESGADLLQDAKVSKPTLVILGHEGRGMRTNLKTLCTRHLTIPGPKLVVGNENYGFVDSLNVGVASGLIMSQLVASATSTINVNN